MDSHKPCPWCRTAEFLHDGGSEKPTGYMSCVRCFACGCHGPFRRAADLKTSMDAAWQAWDAMGEQQTDEKGRPMTYWGGKK